MVSERRKRKTKTSFLGDIQEDFQEIEENFQTDFTMMKNQKDLQETILQNDSLATTSPSDLQALQLSYERKFEELKKENQLLKLGRKELSANEKRILNAIRSEAILQKKDNPIIGRTKLKKEYGINSKYLDSAISGLIQQNIIKRTKISFTKKIITYEWMILR